MLSVVIPAYNEETAVPAAVRETAEVLQQAQIPYELIFVDDGSSDGTWQAIRAASRADACVRGLSFSRNFGKEAAILAGLVAKDTSFEPLDPTLGRLALLYSGSLRSSPLV